MLRADTQSRRCSGTTVTGAQASAWPWLEPNRGWSFQMDQCFILLSYHDVDWIHGQVPSRTHFQPPPSPILTTFTTSRITKYQWWNLSQSIQIIQRSKSIYLSSGSPSSHFIRAQLTITNKQVASSNTPFPSREHRNCSCLHYPGWSWHSCVASTDILTIAYSAFFIGGVTNDNPTSISPRPFLIAIYVCAIFAGQIGYCILLVLARKPETKVRCNPDIHVCHWWPSLSSVENTC